jgi:hypothetical protein
MEIFLELRITLLCFLLASVAFSLCVFVADVQAIVPEIQEVVFWNNGENAMVNVTFYHTPVTAFHYVNQIEVDIDGVVTSYPISQPSVTFTAQINLGQISGNQLGRTRAHCTIDGWSSWSSQQTVPELSLSTIISLCLVGTLMVFVAKKTLFRQGS